MTNLTKYLVIVGVLIAIGAMLLIYGSQTITGDLVIEEGKISDSVQLEIMAGLDPDVNTQGVYAIPVSYTHLRAHETGRNLVCRLLLE